MKSHYTRIVTASALIILLTVQIIWLYHSYHFVKAELSNRTTELLEIAINSNTFERLKKLPEGTMVPSRPQSELGKNTPEFTYMQEELEKLGSPILLDSLTYTFDGILISNGFNNDYTISILKGDSIIDERATDSTTLLSIETKKIPLRKDYSIVIQARLYNPYQLYYDRIGGLLVSTTLLVILIIGCIIYQILIVIKQDESCRFAKTSPTP